ncbi:MAG: hypothetical protein RXR10_08195 [Vulcanisaeta sp.]
MSPLIVGISCVLSSIDLTMNFAYEAGMMDLKLTAPVFNGDTLHNKSNVPSVKEGSKDNRVYIVTVKTTVFNDFSKTQVAEFTRKFALYKRQFSPRWRVWKM